MSKIGVVIAQLGTPDAPEPAALRAYLREFLGDPRVLDMSAALRWFLLNCIILPFRPKVSAALYRRVWTEGGSPLLLTSREQERGVQERLGDGFAVEVGMRYGSPRLREALERLADSGIRRIVVLPMFPQYSCATTASIFDAVADTVLRRRDIPAVRIVRDYPTEPGYIRSIAQAVRASIRTGGTPDHFLFSFHGEPVRFVEEGDPYGDHCEATARALAGALELTPDQWTQSYQSRFGREEWLGPATDDVLARLGGEGCGRVIVTTPGFTADCLETIDEIGRVSASVFREAGGRDFLRVPCVNADSVWLDTMAELIRREAAGW